MSALESSKSGTIIQRIPAKQGVEMALKLDLDNRINLLSSIISQMQKMMTCATLSISEMTAYLSTILVSDAVKLYSVLSAGMVGILDSLNDASTAQLRKFLALFELAQPQTTLLRQWIVRLAEQRVIKAVTFSELPESIVSLLEDEIRNKEFSAEIDADIRAEMKKAMEETPLRTTQSPVTKPSFASDANFLSAVDVFSSFQPFNTSSPTSNTDSFLLQEIKAQPITDLFSLSTDRNSNLTTNRAIPLQDPHSAQPDPFFFDPFLQISSRPAQLTNKTQINTKDNIY